MEKINSMLKEANKVFKTSDHLAYMTYSFVQDKKLLISIAENLNNALLKFMDIILYYDRLYKRINIYPENFNSKFEIFKKKCAPRYSFDDEHLKIIKELHDFMEERKKSNMEFIRNNRFFIAGSNYDMKSIEIGRLKNYINKSKNFVAKVNSIFSN